MSKRGEVIFFSFTKDYFLEQAVHKQMKCTLLTIALKSWFRSNGKWVWNQLKRIFTEKEETDLIFKYLSTRKKEMKDEEQCDLLKYSLPRILQWLT